MTLFLTKVALATGKLDEVKKEYEMKLDEYARLLDLRQARIKVSVLFESFPFSSLTLYSIDTHFDASTTYSF